MPIFRLTREIAFPPPTLAEPSGLLAVGGDLSPSRLLLAYSIGIFPWYSEGQPILWHSPDPRMVLTSDALKVNKSLRQALRKQPYEIRLDTAFQDVVASCADIPRSDQDGTWITDEMLDAYCHLHELGFAHSVEAWRGDELVGGAYGICIGGIFCGESMFAKASDASKIAFVTLIRQLERWGVELIDCQVYTDHLARFGAVEWPRERFLEALEEAVLKPQRRGAWTLDDDLTRGALPSGGRRR